MKSLVFIDCVIIDPTIQQQRLFKKLIDVCQEFFSHIYLVSRNVIKYLDDVEIIHVPCNKTFDHPGIYYINKINNNIKCYSLKLNVNKDKCNIEEDETFHVHVTYKHINLNKTFNFKNFKAELQMNLSLFFRTRKISVKQSSSVAVLDLDDTIIDEKGEIIIENLGEYLTILKSLFGYIMLWSHGCQEHVNHIFKNSLAPYKSYFNLIVARSSSFQTKNKGISLVLQYLNTKEGILELDSTILIDDQPFNYNNDYDYFLHVPNKNKCHSERMWKLLIEVKKEMSQKLKFTT